MALPANINDRWYDMFTTDGGGNVALRIIGTAGSAVPGNPLTSVQFNSGGGFAGSADFSWDALNTSLILGDPTDIIAVNVNSVYLSSGQRLGHGEVGYHGGFAAFVLMSVDDVGFAAPVMLLAAAGQMAGLMADNASVEWDLQVDGAFRPAADNAWDLGTPTNRVRSLYAGTSVVTPLIVLDGNNVSFGANDSGGTGFRQLLVPNA